MSRELWLGVILLALIVVNLVWFSWAVYTRSADLGELEFMGGVLGLSCIVVGALLYMVVMNTPPLVLVWLGVLLLGLPLRAIWASRPPRIQVPMTAPQRVDDDPVYTVLTCVQFLVIAVGMTLLGMRHLWADMTMLAGLGVLLTIQVLRRRVGI